MGKALWVLLLLVCLPLTAQATGDYDFTLREDTAVINKYTGSSTRITVPASLVVDGREYATVLNSATVFAENQVLQSVTLESGVGFVDGRMDGLFKNCKNLQSVTFGTHTGITGLEGAFYQCQSLTALDLSGLVLTKITDLDYLFCGCSHLRELTGYEAWDTGSVESMYMTFSNTTSLSFLDLSRWDLSQVKNTGWCFQTCYASTILLPQSLHVISAGFFNHASRHQGQTFTVPAGVSAVGLGHTFYDFGNYFTAFSVAPGNTACKAVDGILYSADGTTLYAIPRNKSFPDGVFAIAEGVTFLGELSFSRNRNIQTVLLPDSYEISLVEKNDPRYILYKDNGNLNSGNSLNIAVYLHTGVTRYQVKPTNPRYTSIDGVLYTKDRAALVAVPARYDGYIAIPQGVSRWESEAMWSVENVAVDSYMGKCQGVSIPKSLTYIADDQLRKLNRLAKRGLVITLEEDNPSYRLYEGMLVAKTQVSALEVELETDRYVYDGTKKLPQIQVWDGEQLLIPGQDYVFRYENNQNAGEATVILTGQGLYGGERRIPFTVEKAPLPPKDLPSLQGYYGQSLRQLDLPREYTWETDSLLGAVGEKTFPAIRKSEDPNYADQPVRIPVTVEPRPVFLQVEIAEKTFDFSTSAQFSVHTEGFLPGDQVTLDRSRVQAVFASPWPGERISVTLRGSFSLSGADAGSYVLCQPNIPCGTILHSVPLIITAITLPVLTAGLVIFLRKRRAK